MVPETPVLCLVLTREGEPWKFFSEAAERQGFFVAETGSRFSARLAQMFDRPNSERWKQTFWLSENDPHPNAFGHEILAAVVLKAIEENGLLGSTVPEKNSDAG